MIPESFIEHLKDANPIDEVISSYVQLKRQGRNLKGLCPFHSEKTPSFVVYPDDTNPHYHCFGCGSGGDVITFIRNIEHLEYIEALRFLASRAGLALPEDGTDDRTAKMKTRVLELNREAARFFHQCLKEPTGEVGLNYLIGRGLSIKTIKRFGLGYAPKSWNSLRNHLRSKGFRDEEMLAAAVVSQGRNSSTYDSFRHRVIFPIIDLRGNVIGFGGRTLESGGPKYLNSADTPVFKKSRNLFAMNLAKNTTQDCLLLAEGYMDVIAIHQAGFDNAVATLGTALTAEQARLIAQYTKKVVIAYDSDGAGQAATKRAINLLGETDLAVTVLEIPGAKDPDEYIRKFGAERFSNLVTGSKGAIAFELDKLRAKHDLNDPEGKSAFLTEFCRYLADISNDLQRDVYISETARELDISRDVIVSTINTLRKRRQHSQRKQQARDLRVYTQEKAETRAARPPIGGLTGFVAEQKLLALLMRYPDRYDIIQPLLDASDIANDDHRAIFDAICARLAARQTPELIHLSASLSPAQMGLLTRLVEENRNIPFHPGQETEFCRAIRAQQQNKTPEQVKDMTPEEYQQYITSLAVRKK